MLPVCLLHACKRVSWVSAAASYSRSHRNMDRPVETAIRSKITQSFAPHHLEVHNESYMHAVPAGSETHFKVVVISEMFAGKSLIQRHRLLNELLKEELAGPVHALSIVAKTPEQWEENPSVGKSPACMGGSKDDPEMSKKLAGLETGT